MQSDLVNYKAGPNRIILEVTNRCNLNCSMCLRHSWNNTLGSMAPEVFARLISDLAVFQSPPEVFFGGYGEPLSHPDILGLIRQAAAGGSRIALISNGTLLTPKLIESLVKAGLRKLWVSADSSHQDAILQSQSRDTHPVLLDLLAEIQRQTSGMLEKLEPGLAFVMTRNNQAEILDLLEQGQNLGVRSFYITCLEAYTADQSMELPYSLQELRTPGSWRSAYSDFIQTLDQLTINQSILSIDGPLTDPRSTCPFAEQGDLVLRWDGEISPCLPLLYDRTTYIENWEHKQFSYTLGNIRNRSLSEIWEDSSNSLLRERLLNKDFSPCLSCRDCWLSEDNRQDCMGFEHPTCGGCLWAEGLISCP